MRFEIRYFFLEIGLSPSHPNRIVTHALTYWPDKMDKIKSKMKIIQRYRNTFERQIGESVWINHNIKEGTTLLNSKKNIIVVPSQDWEF